MKALVVTNMYPGPADAYAGVFVQRQVEALRTDGVDVEVCHVDTPSAQSRYVTSRSRVARAIETSRPDIVHVHFGLTQILVPTTTIPRVVTFHGSDLMEPRKRVVSRAFARGAAAAIVVAPHLAEQIADIGMPVTVIPAGVPRRMFDGISRETARETLRIEAGATIALFPASPRRRVKRHALFSDAMKLLPGVEPLVLEDVPPERVPLYLAASDVVVLTSEHEGSPVVTKEAMCAGTRVVSVPTGDMRWQVDGMSGCLVAEEASPKAVADAVREALAAPGPDARRAAERFDVALESAAVRRVYESVLAETRLDG